MLMFFFSFYTLQFLINSCFTLKNELVEETFLVYGNLHAGQADLPMPFSFLQNVQTGPGVHPGSYLMGSWVNFREQSVRGREVSPFTSIYC